MFDKFVLAVGITLAINLFTSMNQPSADGSEALTIASPQPVPVQVTQNVQNQPHLATRRSRGNSLN